MFKRQPYSSDHGADRQSRYRWGLLLLAKDDPGVVLARCGVPVFEPVESYERSGFFGQVVFTNGYVQRGDELLVYYGAADAAICLARSSVSAWLDSFKCRRRTECALPADMDCFLP